MAIPKINSSHGSDTRNVINEVIKTINDRGLEILSESGFLAWLEENGIKHRQEVATFNDLPSSDSLNTVRGVLSDNKIYIKKENGWVPFQTIDISKINKIERTTEDIMYSVRDFGAIGDGIADDTAALNYAINNIPLGSTLKIGKGNFKTTGTILIDQHINFIMDGVIVAHHDDVAIKVTEAGVGTTQMPEFVLRARKAEINHSLNSVGVEIHNTYHSKMWLPYISGFTTNIRLIADNGRGVVYDQITLGQIHNGKIQIHITADHSTRGWTNQNIFYGGRLYYSPLNTREGYIQILIDGETGTDLYRNNGNVFYGTSLEDVGFNGTFSKAVVCGGIFNSFNDIRTEGSMDWLFTGSSYRNVVNNGTYIYTSNIEDLGIFNQVNTIGTGSKSALQTGTHRFIAGANGTVGATFEGNGSERIPAQFINKSGEGFSALEVLSPVDNLRAVSIRANGSWDVRKDRKVHFGTYVTHPANGNRGDISFVTNPTLSDPIGYVCYSSNDGGKWKPFGATIQKPSAPHEEMTMEELINSYTQLIDRLQSAGIINN